MAKPVNTSAPTPAIDWSGASWWWARGEIEPLQYAEFARDLELTAAPDHAWVALSGGSLLTLWVNGQWVHHGPPREVPPFQYYEVLDLRHWLYAGTNTLRLRAWHIGRPTQWHEPCQAGILLRGIVDEHRLDERSAWRARMCPSQLPDPPHLHSCAGYGEHVDLSEPEDAWLAADEGRHWPEPVVVAEHPLPERPHLLPSDSPALSGRRRSSVYAHESQGRQVWDFGQEVFGFIELEVDSPHPMSCDITHGESVRPDGLPDQHFSGGDWRDRLELPVGPRTWHSFEKRALRYLSLPAEVRVLDLAVREYHQPLIEIWRSRAGSISMLDRRILSAAARTVTLCADDLLNDCPRRERGQYNDPGVYMQAFPRLFGTWEPIRRWLRQFLRGADEAGILRMCYPSPRARGTIPDFSIGFARQLLEYARSTGDWETSRSAFAPALAGVQAFERHAGTDGLLRDVPGWVFLCNSFELAKSPSSAALNALWASAWNALGDLGEHCADPRAEGYRKRSRQLRERWREAFWHDGRLLDAESSPQHEALAWWNYHHSAATGTFTDEAQPPVTLRFQWSTRPGTLRLATHGGVQLRVGHEVVFEGERPDAWKRPAPWEHWLIEWPAQAHPGAVWEIELAFNRIDWEVFISADEGQPVDLTVEGEPRAFRPWFAPRYNQITAGYAVACGMLDGPEASSVLRACLREHYHVPWLKRTTPLIAEATADAELLRNRAVLCNTPQSLAFFGRALQQYGLAGEARDLCRRLFGMMLDHPASTGTLWEEFAPRSSLCHGWGAICVEHLLPP